MLLWTQLKNCLEMMKKTGEEQVRAEELTKRRIMLEKHRDCLKEMKQRSTIEPVMREQKEPEFKNIEQLCRAVKKLQLIQVDPCKCEVVIPPVTINKETTLMIMLKNEDNFPVTNISEGLSVSVIFGHDNSKNLGPVKEVGDGRYEVSFTATRFGCYMISITVDGHHIPGNRYM